jgi:AcrR family transcriptional regulator
MTSPATQQRPASARERLLAAADELFYAEGIQSVGIDRVIERAGVAKASLYNTFGSKEALVQAYLEKRDAERRGATLAKVAAAQTIDDKVLAVFDRLADVAGRPDFRGCAFVNASAEAHPGGAVEHVTQEFRHWMRGLLTDLATQAGARDPAQLASQLHQLYDGAAVAAHIDRDATSPQTARAAAAVLLRDQTGG